MRDMMDRKCCGHHERGDGRIVFGILIVIAGLLAFLSNIHVIHNFSIWDYWPVILIVIGISRFFKPFTGSGQYVEGLIWIAIGTILLLDNLNLFEFSIGKYWPLLLVLVGIMIILHSFSATRAVSGGLNIDSINVTSILGGSNYNYTSKTLKGGKLTAIMGGSKLDMRNAEMDGDSMVIDSFIMMGGMELLVPEHWRVILQATPILGGVEDKTMLKEDSKSGKSSKVKELILKGVIIMGGIEIHN
jgi:predicted membrane protein